VVHRRCEDVFVCIEQQQLSPEEWSARQIKRLQRVFMHQLAGPRFLLVCRHTAQVTLWQRKRLRRRDALDRLSVDDRETGP
jgi:hypothetical protein